MDLPTNTSLKGMIELEYVFDSYLWVRDMYPPSSKGGKYEKVNLGKNIKDKNVFIGTSTSTKEKGNILIVLQEYIDVIVWNYKHIKIYNKSMMTYIVTLN